MISIFFYWSTPMIITTMTFAIYIYLGNELTAGKAFVVISAFQVLCFSLRDLPTSIADTINAWNSFKRIEKFLLDEK